MEASSVAAQKPSLKRDLEGCPKARDPQGGTYNGLTWTDTPLDIQLLVLAYMPLVQLARMATLCKLMRAVYKERLQERHTCIQDCMAEGWPSEVSEGLSPEDTAVPRDLVTSPPIPERLQCSPELNTPSYAMETHWCGHQPGVYRGFVLKGKPDGRGEWVADNGHTYVGNWRGGLRHGHGKETAKTGQTYVGDFREGKWDEFGEGVLRRADGTWLWSVGGGGSTY